MSKFYSFIYSILWGLMKVFFPWKVHNRENLPTEGGVLLCANHTSFLDPLLILCAVTKKRQLHVMSKAELFRIPVLGFILKGIEMIPVKRGMSDVPAFKDSLRILRSEKPLLIFPEGTRVKEGKRVKGHTGAVTMASRADVPVLPIYIRKARFIFCRSHIYFGQPYMLEFSGRKPTPDESRALTDDLMHRIYELGDAV